MNFLLIVNDDKRFGPILLRRLINLGEKPSYVAICERFPPNATLRSKISYLTAMALTLPPAFVLSYLFGSNRETMDDVLREHQISFRRYTDANSPDFVNDLKNPNAQIGISICSQIYKRKTIDSFPFPVFNIHGGSLAENRGRYPFFWTAALRLQPEITVHQIDKIIDGGPTILRKFLPNSANESVVAMTTAYAHELPDTILDVLRNFRSQTITPMKTVPGIYRLAPSPKDIFKYWFRQIRN